MSDYWCSTEPGRQKRQILVAAGGICVFSGQLCALQQASLFHPLLPATQTSLQCHSLQLTQALNKNLQFTYHVKTSMSCSSVGFWNEGKAARLLLASCSFCPVLVGKMEPGVCDFAQEIQSCL